MNTRYAQVAVAAEVAKLQAAPHGGRNQQTFQSAAALGELVGAGILDEEDTRAALLDAATAAGLPWREARDAVKSGLRRGRSKPREVQSKPGWTAAPVVARRAPAAPAEPAPVYPPLAEVAALWSACAALTDVPWGYRGGGRWADPAVPWLEKWRGLSCRALGALDLARLLPLDPDAHPWPSWIPRLGMGRADWLQLYRLAVPMYDATGALRSLRFRAVTDVCEPGADGLRWRALDVKGHQKALAPSGSTVRGLALADPVGRALLAGELASAPWDGRVVVTEGEPDLWTWSTRQRRGMAPDALTWAVLGVVNGSWNEDLAARVPSGAKVALRTHADAAGDAYAENIRRTLAKRCEVRRAVIPGEREED